MSVFLNFNISLVDHSSMHVTIGAFFHGAVTRLPSPGGKTWLPDPANLPFNVFIFLQWVG
jgi:hypothetical protein